MKYVFHFTVRQEKGRIIVRETATAPSYYSAYLKAFAEVKKKYPFVKITVM